MLPLDGVSFKNNLIASSPLVPNNLYWVSVEFSRS